jgi:two-component system, cell cycle response regulator CtrA
MEATWFMQTRRQHSRFPSGTKGLEARWRVLLAADEVMSSRSIETMLTKAEFIFDTIDLREDGVEIGQLPDPDIILLDLTREPESLNFEVLRQCRAARRYTPILILWGFAELTDKVKAIGCGADDFLSKPFDGRELSTRILTMVRRFNRLSDRTIRTGRLLVDLDTRAVSVDDHAVYLTEKEYAILELLSLNKGTVLTKQTLIDHLYAGIEQPEAKVINGLFSRLRKNLVWETGGEQYIGTVGRHGYVLRVPLAPAAAQERKGR